MMRPVYRCLLALHPANFREKFADETLWIFDESRGACDQTALLLDAFVSLLRQWFLRSEPWKGFVAILGGIVSLIAGFGSFIPWENIWRAVRSAF
jgi:hypothetical protein